MRISEAPGPPMGDLVPGRPRGIDLAPDEVRAGLMALAFITLAPAGERDFKLAHMSLTDPKQHSNGSKLGIPDFRMDDGHNNLQICPRIDDLGGVRGIA